MKKALLLLSLVLGVGCLVLLFVWDRQAEAEYNSHGLVKQAAWLGSAAIAGLVVFAVSAVSAIIIRK